MGSRGRKSQADLSVVRTFRISPPKPPADLTKEQAEEWKIVTECMPGDWFPKETHGVLADHCRHVCRARLLAAALDGAEKKHLDTAAGIDCYDKLSRMADRETKALLSCARALRLTNQARYDPKTAARRRAGRTGPRPWETDYADASLGNSQRAHSTRARQDSRLAWLIGTNPQRHANFRLIHGMPEHEHGLAK